jgi:subtilase family serine protease
VSNFLSAKGLTVVSVAENNLYIKAQGSVDDIQKAFNVQIHSYQKTGANYHSNTADPSVNDSSRGLIAAITGLDDYGFQPQVVQAGAAEGVSAWRPAASPQGLLFEGQCFRPVETDTFSSTTDLAIYTGNRYGANITNTGLGPILFT